MTETDVEGAKQLLADAGVTEMTLTLGYPTINAYGVDFGQLAQVLQQQLAEVGVTLELAPDTFAVMIDKFRTRSSTRRTSSTGLRTTTARRSTSATSASSRAPGRRRTPAVPTTPR